LVLFSFVLSGICVSAVNLFTINKQPDYNVDLQPVYHTEEYDMVIIAPDVFLQELQPLIEHKNNYGIRTFLETTNDIYNEFDGADKPEQIKYFIKDAIETRNIKYVLLVGGLKYYIWNNPRDTINAGEEYWHVPVRY